MAQVIHMDSSFPGKSTTPLPHSLLGKEELPYSVETPYGYRLDLDFLKYVNDIEKGNTIKKVPIQRRPRYGSLPRGYGYAGSWWTSTESLCSNASMDSRHSSFSYCAPGYLGSRPAAGGAFRLGSAHVEKTLLDARKRLEEEKEGRRFANLGSTRSSVAGSTSSLSGAYSTGRAQGAAHHTPLSSGLSTPVSPTPAHLQHVREQMAQALRKIRELEEQVKTIPLLQVKISVLQEEKRQLSVQLKSQKFLGHTLGFGKSRHQGELYIHIPEEEALSPTTSEGYRQALGCEIEDTVIVGAAAQSSRKEVRSIGVGPELERGCQQVGVGVQEQDLGLVPETEVLRSQVGQLEMQLKRILQELWAAQSERDRRSPRAHCAVRATSMGLQDPATVSGLRTVLSFTQQPQQWKQRTVGIQVYTLEHPTLLRAERCSFRLRAHGDTAQTLPTDTAQALPTVTAQAPPTATAQTLPTDIAQALPTVTAQALPTDTVQALPTVTVQALPTVTAQARPTVTGQAPPTVTGQAPPTVTAQAPPTVTTQAPPTVTGQAPPTVTAQALPTVTVQALPTVTTQAYPTDTAQTPPTDTAQAPPTKTGPDLSIEIGQTPPIETDPTLPIETGLTPPIETGPVPHIDTGLTLSIETGPVLPIDTGLTLPIETGPVLPIDTGLPRDIDPVLPIDTGLPRDIDPTPPTESSPALPIHAVPSLPIEAAPAPPIDTGPITETTFPVCPQTSLECRGYEETLQTEVCFKQLREVLQKSDVSTSMPVSNPGIAMETVCDQRLKEHQDAPLQTAVEAIQSEDTSKPASRRRPLRSIMKRRAEGQAPSPSAKKNLQFIGVNGGYESTSSEESSSEDSDVSEYHEVTQRLPECPLQHSKDRSTVSHTGSSTESQQGITQSPSTEQATQQVISQSPSTEQETQQDISQSLSTAQATQQVISQSPSTEQATQQDITQSPSTEQATPPVITQSPSTEQATQQVITQSPSTQQATQQVITQSPSTQQATQQDITQSPSTEQATQQDITQSPSTEQATQQVITQSPSTQQATQQDITQSPSTERETQQDITQSPSTEQATQQDITQSPSTEQATQQDITQSPSTEQATQQDITQSPSTERETQQDITQSPIIDLPMPQISTKSQTPAQESQESMTQSQYTDPAPHQCTSESPVMDHSCIIESPSPDSPFQEASIQSADEPSPKQGTAQPASSAPAALRKTQGQPGVNSSSTQSVTQESRLELSDSLMAALLALQKALNESNAFAQQEARSAYTLVLQEWLRVSSHKAANVGVVRAYMDAFATISAQLLEFVINMADGNGNTALHYTVSHSNFPVVRLLLDTGHCNANKQNKAGYTAIMLTALAAFHSDTDLHTVLQLLHTGDVNAKASQAGQTALMLAVSHGRGDMVGALLSCGAEVNIQDEDGSTALMCACEHGHVDIVRQLLAVPGCDATLTDNDGSTALSIALEACHNDIAVLLHAHLSFTKPPSPVAARSPPSNSAGETK
ncbi:KN motif and ankyrin repeat domain-containing protein 2-like isoform X2 [Megalops cyprinoides]|uniref:KN motif and ankyrin repeat domain-containing protein 2-like isoform X2 n=1 Tax=Megalops cyprinoides TaxID=118141 RepID=UPI00186406E6|nr:KN motif and ankyrin repeat domain-containing protein 2-like isoform X2 [Megalops cyprinoides]